MKQVTVFFAALLCAGILSAQRTERYNDADADLRQAILLYLKERYASAQFLLERDEDGSKQISKSERDYYRAASAMGMLNADADYQALQFVRPENASPQKGYASYRMGLHSYQFAKFPETIEWLEKADTAGLDAEELNEYRFKLGYCYFVQNRPDDAALRLAQVRDTGSRYALPALYYGSHIHYEQGHYETALQGFNVLLQNEVFAPIAPFYITHIYFKQRKYDEVIQYAPGIVEQASEVRKPEIKKMIGVSYFKRGKFAEALPYLEAYAAGNESMTRDDYYELGYTFYKASKFPQALEMLNKVTGENDTVAQNAYYHLGDCYVRSGQKMEAMQAFSAAMKQGPDSLMREDAHWNYAKLTYELSYSPFNEAIKAMETYIAAYPESQHGDEAQEYLVEAYLNTNNFKDAYSSLNKIGVPNSKTDAAMQKAAYYYGLELFNSLNFEEAIKLFDKSIAKQEHDKRLQALAYYWKAEALYRLEKYPAAQAIMQKFVILPAAFNSPEYANAHYGLGYMLFKQQNWAEAGTWFRKYTELKAKDSKSDIRSDAANRAADCYFMQRQYQQAIMLYEKNIKDALIDADYAMYQKGFCYGLVKEHPKKIFVLKKLISTYPRSRYRADAMYELARTYMDQKDNASAASYYQKVVDSFPSSSFHKRSLLQLGLIYYNTGKNQKAIEVYKQMIEDHPNTSDAKCALMSLQNIYIDINDANGYMEYARTLGEFGNLTMSKQDSLLYLSAEGVYMKEEYAKARNQLDAYLKKFPEGFFMINAHYYKADCDFRASKMDEALSSLEVVISRGKTSFSEDALITAARICRKKKEYAKAAGFYQKLEVTAEYPMNILEAREGQTTCYYEAGDCENASKAAESLLRTEKVAEEQQRSAQFIIARCAEKAGRMDDALARYQELAKDMKNPQGAEAKYRVIQILYDKNSDTRAEEEVLSFLDAGSQQLYWLAKSYMVWADIYERKKDYFQARYTLQGLLDNYQEKNDGIIIEANKKLAHLDELEQAPKPEAKVEEINLDKQ